MIWPGIIALIAATCLLLPLLLVRQRLLFRAKVYAPPVPLNSITTRPVRDASSAPTPPSTRTISRAGAFTGDTATKLLVQNAAPHFFRTSNYIAPRDYTRQAFPYIIRRHTGSHARHVADCGGYAEVPFLLHDHQGNGYTIYRRVALN